MQLKFAVLFFLCFVFLIPSSVRAKRVYFSSDGTPITDTSPTDSSNSESTKKLMTPAEKMSRDAAAAAAAGYALGQTVKVENGIIYKLDRDPKSKAYTFKRYRRVIKMKSGVSTPEPPIKAQPDARVVEKNKSGDLAKEKQVSEATKKTNQEAVAKATQAAVVAEKAQQDALAKEKQAAIAAEKFRQNALEDEKAKKEKERLAQEALIKQKALDAKALEEERRINEAARLARIDAEQKALRQSEVDARAEDERLRIEREYNGPMILGRRLAPGKIAIAAEHSFLNRKTVLKSRAVTTGTGTENDATGVGVKDIFYTDTHADMLIVRYGLTRRLEINVEAGMTFEQLSEIADMEPAYGAGFRCALGQLPLGSRTELYLDVSGRYFMGKVTGSFSDPYGFAYDKSSDFQEIDLGFEAGLTVSNVTFFAGLAYTMYTEDTVREQRLTPPDLTILNDEMEGQGNFIFKAGVQYRLIPQLCFYLEGQVFSREGLLAGMEYRF